MSTTDLPLRVERALRRAHGLTLAPLLVGLHIAVAQALFMLVAEGGGDVVEKARLADDYLRRGVLFGPGLYLSLGLRKLAFPGVKAFDWDDESAGSQEDSSDLVYFPELFEVASPAYDGITYGFVVHAPELSLGDAPMAEWDPRGGVGAIQSLGSDLRQGLTRLLSRQAACLREGSAAWYPEDAPHAAVALARLEALARPLELDLDQDAPATVFDPEGGPVVPVVPGGYRFEPTRDGVGVLAPADTFGDEHVAFVDALDAPDQEAIPAAISLAERALGDGHPASALLVVRETLHGLWFDDVASALHAPMRRAYLALGRPILAERVG